MNNNNLEKTTQDIQKNLGEIIDLKSANGITVEKIQVDKIEITNNYSTPSIPEPEKAHTEPPVTSESMSTETLHQEYAANAEREPEIISTSMENTDIDSNRIKFEIDEQERERFANFFDDDTELKIRPQENAVKEAVKDTYYDIKKSLLWRLCVVLGLAVFALVLVTIVLGSDIRTPTRDIIEIWKQAPLESLNNLK